MEDARLNFEWRLPAVRSRRLGCGSTEPNGRLVAAQDRVWGNRQGLDTRIRYGLVDTSSEGQVGVSRSLARRWFDDSKRFGLDLRTHTIAERGESRHDRGCREDLDDPVASERQRWHTFVPLAAWVTSEPSMQVLRHPSSDSGTAGKRTRRSQKKDGGAQATTVALGNPHLPGASAGSPARVAGVMCEFSTTLLLRGRTAPRRF